LIQKVAAIMDAIPWAQSFFDGNRRTSIVAAGTFLRDNGYELDISPEEENTELREMLRSRNINMTLSQLLWSSCFYVSKRMNKYEPKT